MRRDDIVRDFIRRVHALHPEQPRDDLLRLEYELRRDWGGHAYVKKCDPAAAPPAKR